MGLRRSKSPAKKRKKIINSWIGANRTRAPNFRVLSPKNGVDIRSFVRKTCVICVVT